MWKPLISLPEKHYQFNFTQYVVIHRAVWMDYWPFFRFRIKVKFKKSVIVTPLYVVEGNLDAATGDVDFNGDVIVQGNVFAGGCRTLGNQHLFIVMSSCRQFQQGFFLYACNRKSRFISTDGSSRYEQPLEMPDDTEIEKLLKYSGTNDTFLQ